MLFISGRNDKQMRAQNSNRATKLYLQVTRKICDICQSMQKKAAVFYLRIFATFVIVSTFSKENVL